MLAARQLMAQETPGLPDIPPVFGWLASLTAVGYTIWQALLARRKTHAEETKLLDEAKAARAAAAKSEAETERVEIDIDRVLDELRLNKLKETADWIQQLQTQVHNAMAAARTSQEDADKARAEAAAASAEAQAAKAQSQVAETKLDLLASGVRRFLAVVAEVLLEVPDGPRAKLQAAAAQLTTVLPPTVAWRSEQHPDRE